MVFLLELFICSLTRCKDMKIVLAPILILLIFGCLSTETPNAPKTTEQQAIDRCISLCLTENASGTNLSNGPCLSNKIIADWVCDVAHNPRQDMDNDPANQCSGFGVGSAHHFVEVSLDCEFIKKY